MLGLKLITISKRDPGDAVIFVIVVLGDGLADTWCQVITHINEELEP